MPYLCFMVYSILDLAYVMKGDSFHQTFEKSAKAARFAEDLGYTRYWVSEHHNMPNVISSATSVLIGYLAAHTQKIRVGSGGIMLPNHTPLVIAEQFGTLEAMYPNRIDLGLGRAPGTDMKTATILRRGEAALHYDFEAHIKELEKYFATTNNQSDVRALPGEGAEVPLYILGSSIDSAFLAAKLGRPYAFAGHFAPSQFFTAYEIYKEHFQPSIHLEKPYMMLCANFIVAEQDEEAHYLSRSMFQAFANIISDTRQPILSPDECALDNLGSQHLDLLKKMTAFTFIGSPETVKNQLKTLLEDTAIDEFIVSTNIFDHRMKLKSYQLTADIFRQL